MLRAEMVGWKTAATWWAAILAGTSAVAGVAFFAWKQRSPPARCPAALVDHGARCCALGQSLSGSRCVGRPRACPAGLLVLDTGCVFKQQAIPHVPGTLVIGPSDWEAQGLVAPRSVGVDAFRIDRTEVTVAEWKRCVTTERCRELPDQEPGLPVTNVTPSEAETYCRFVGGRLPTADEWMWAASGSQARRYPWGDTGLVCRRAVYGTEAGPCARGSTSPEIAGAVAQGATPLGVRDLAGNVAEWTLESEGIYAARGGSFRSAVARELKVWGVQRTRTPAAHIGFRCVYPDL